MAEQAGGAQEAAPGDAGRSEHADKTISAILGEILWLAARIIPAPVIPSAAARLGLKSRRMGARRPLVQMARIAVVWRRSNRVALPAATVQA